MVLPKIISFLPYPEDYLIAYLTRSVDPSEFEFVVSQLPSKEEALLTRPSTYGGPSSRHSRGGRRSTPRTC